MDIKNNDTLLRGSFTVEAIYPAVVETAASQKDAPRSDEGKGETW
jgi:hypothetical protein